MIFSKIGKINYKIPTILLLQSLGITKKKLLTTMKNFDTKQNKKIKKSHIPLVKKNNTSLKQTNKQRTDLSLRKTIYKNTMDLEATTTKKTKNI